MVHRCVSRDVISPVGSITDALYEASCGISSDQNDAEILKSMPVSHLLPIHQHVLRSAHGTFAKRFCLGCWGSNAKPWATHIFRKLLLTGFRFVRLPVENCSLTLGHFCRDASEIVTIFCVCHVAFVEDILGRHIGQEKDEQCERFLVEKLCVPSQWIEECRAVKSLYAFNPKLHATSLLAAELYSQAHDVICDDELAPEIILSETYLELEELLAVPERFSTIADWYLIRTKFFGIVSQSSKP
ncbi:hypothetical protein DAPPUDRAFT_118557 [Daphnia pulex]|uniref:Nuclear pore complex protein NUP96 C-terminal domain-containing protein n=1 Tax=Daphnia pulex TaxID=6669 RepID=E9HVZ6_DAPPU|nr:hypothetical protein DAPPUDRAFT_118557 [Daphnia pulex]|eukprot:EFX64084.1 hypothetical protein DAPPUDRAFT_118557 [Daphnia pulex]